MKGLPPSTAGTVVTVGSFDGVHLGHRSVLARLAARARLTGLQAVLVTFDPHPLEIVNPGAAPMLLTVGDEKSEVLAESTLDYVVVLPFTHDLAAYTAEQFVETILIDRVRMHEILIGHDHGFGRNRGGNAAMLRTMGSVRGFAVDVIEPVGNDQGHAFSSTAIRRAVAGGDLERAAQALGRPYAVNGVVIAGVGRGRSLGFRTINLTPPPARKLLPPEGVYAVRVQTPRGPFSGMMNLGGRPTFGESEIQLEAHLFDASVELYGDHVRLDFIARLRETRRFASPESLSAQLRRDEAAARVALDVAGHGS